MIFISNTLNASNGTISFSLVHGTEQVITFRARDGYKCFRFSKYKVVAKDKGESVGSDIYVKYSNPNSEFPSCEDIMKECDFIIKNEWAEYFWGIYKDFLIIESGTCPDGSKIIFYNLNTKKKIFESEYYPPVSIDTNGILSFWKTSETPVTEVNCPGMLKRKSSGLGSAIEKEVLLNLSDFSVSETGETRCSSRQ
jgi:hypothetical protein